VWSIPVFETYSSGAKTPELKSKEVDAPF
jgi:hypothetical protein